MWQTLLNATHIGVRTLDGLVRKIVQCLVGNIMALFFFFGGVWKTEEDETNYILVLNVYAWFMIFSWESSVLFAYINESYQMFVSTQISAKKTTRWMNSQTTSDLFTDLLEITAGGVRAVMIKLLSSEITVGVPFMAWLNHVFMGIHIHVVINDSNYNFFFLMYKFWVLKESWDHGMGSEGCSKSSKSSRGVPLHPRASGFYWSQCTRYLWLDGHFP